MKFIYSVSSRQTSKGAFAFWQNVDGRQKHNTPVSQAAFMRLWKYTNNVYTCFVDLEIATTDFINKNYGVNYESVGLMVNRCWSPVKPKQFSVLASDK